MLRVRTPSEQIVRDNEPKEILEGGSGKRAPSLLGGWTRPERTGFALGRLQA